MAALVRWRRWLVLVVLDAWEIRAVVLSPSVTEHRRMLLRERPDALATAINARWIRQMHVSVVHHVPTPPPADLDAFPELRRFAGHPARGTIAAATALADQLLTILACDQRLSEN